jgi:hypothetical protein
MERWTLQQLPPIQREKRSTLSLISVVARCCTTRLNMKNIFFMNEDVVYIKRDERGLHQLYAKVDLPPRIVYRVCRP